MSFRWKIFKFNQIIKNPSLLHQEGTSSCSYRDSSNFPSGFSVLHHHQKIIDRSELHRTYSSPLFDSMPRPQAVSLLDYEEKFSSDIPTCCRAGSVLRLISEQESDKQSMMTVLAILLILSATRAVALSEIYFSLNAVSVSPKPFD